MIFTVPVLQIKTVMLMTERRGTVLKHSQFQLNKSLTDSMALWILGSHL